MLRLFNTISRRMEDFEPLEPPMVRMYTCGPTVYNFAHIGNFRAYVWEDILRRYLKFKGFSVIQVMNLTDVDDKTIRGARETGLSLSEFTERYKNAFFEDIDTLGIERAEFYPAATEHISDMVELITILVDKGVAYRGEDGSIYFSISKFPDYGKLSGKRPESLIPGARISHDEYDKETWADFALWKAWDKEDGNVFWETPLGKGRPGWHIECSAMSMKYLGHTFDIHTGGEDNMFPHHENEIAQSEAATGKKFVKYWLHCAHLIVDGKKMSKSLGNYYTLRNILQRGFDPMSIRYLLLATHYRQQLNFTFDGLSAAKGAIERLTEFRDLLLDGISSGKPGSNPEVIESFDTGIGGFEKAMDDDLNVSGGLGSIFEMIRTVNGFAAREGISCKDAEHGLNIIKRIDSVLGVLKWDESSIPPEVEELIEKREIARKQKNFSKADEIRKKLLELGIEIKDTPSGPKWRRKK